MDEDSTFLPPSRPIPTPPPYSGTQGPTPSCTVFTSSLTSLLGSGAITVPLPELFCLRVTSSVTRSPHLLARHPFYVPPRAVTRQLTGPPDPSCPGLGSEALYQTAPNRPFPQSPPVPGVSATRHPCSKAITRTWTSQRRCACDDTQSLSTPAAE